MVFTLSVTFIQNSKSSCLGVVKFCVNISEDSDRTYSKEAHSMYTLMIPAYYSGDVRGVLKTLSTQV